MPADSGLVIAGFGEHEHFPGVIELGVRGVVAGLLLVERRNEAAVSDGDDQSEALVFPFAQTETVHAFMEGIDPVFRRAIEAETRLLFTRFSLVVLQRVKAHDASFGAALEQELRPAIERLVDELHRDWDERRQKEHVGPVMDMVRALPKDELALMAESLVNLDKFKRRVSRRQETVGGPIDVAVITKGDGFVWVRRKHYFRSELNLRHLASYLGEVKRDYHG